MKIMIVTPYFYPKIGGLENYALNIAKGLKNDHDHELVVVTSNHQRRKFEVDEVEGMKVYRLPAWVKVSNTPINPLWYFQIKKIIKAEKPDVINAHTPVPGLSDVAVRSAGRIPIALTYQNDLVKPSGLGKYMAKLYYLLYMNKTLRKCDRIITSSQYYAENSPYISKYKYKTSIISPGVDIRRFNPSVGKAWLREKYPHKKIVLFAGNMDKTHSHKGLDVLLRAVANAKKSIPGIYLIAVGKGDGISSYKALADGLGLSKNVNFTDFVSDQLLPKYYAGAHVFVLPSTTNAEGFGMVLVEAQACETPVIGTKVGGVPFVVSHNQTGLLVKPGDVKELSQAIITSINNPLTTKQALENVSQNLTWEVACDKTSKIFTRLKLPRVCLIHNIISPYRLPVYEEVNKHVNLTLLFCKPITKDRVWEFDLSKCTFNYKILNGISIGPVIFNSNSLIELIRSRFDLVMANNDPDIAPAVLVGFILAKLQLKKVLVWSLVTTDSVHFSPSIAYSDNILMKLMRKVIGEWVLIYRKTIYKFADHYLAFTGKADHYLRAHGVKKELISRTYQIMPIDLLPVPSQQFKRNGRTFLYVGYFNPRKDVQTLINAFKKIKDQNARLWLAGAGPTEHELKQLAHDDSRIKFLGYVEGQAKADLFAKSDIFVLPTLHDVWGLVINEAIRYGVAVICSDAAEAKELISEDVGRVFHAQDVDELYQQMSSLINDQSYLRSIQANNLRNSSATDTRIAADGYVKAMKAALSQAKS